MALAGSFLIAKPTLNDPNFMQTVVLILAHNPEGAFGLIINRPLKAKGLPFPVFDGGPCRSPGVVILHGHANWVDPSTVGAQGSNQAIAPGIFVGDENCLARATQAASDQDLRCRVYRGFAGWEGGQLERELAHGDWAVVPATGELLFASPLDELWDQLVPPKIPQPSLN
jgi:putative transcriptional regulator